MLKTIFNLYKLVVIFFLELHRLTRLKKRLMHLTCRKTF